MIYLITHTDLDGIGCAILAHLVWDHPQSKERVRVYFQSYDNVNPFIYDLLSSETLKAKDKIIITDLGVSIGTARALDRAIAEKQIEVGLLDHHISNYEKMKPYGWAVVKDKRDDENVRTCGTEMFYCFLRVSGDLDRLINWYKGLHTKVDVKTSIDNFVQLVRRQDTWVELDKVYQGNITPRQLNRLLYICGRDTFISNMINKIDAGIFGIMTPSEELMLSLEEKRINQYIDSKDETLFGMEVGFSDSDDEKVMNNIDFKVGVVYAEQYISELGAELCKRHPDLDLVAIINMQAGRISYRTEKDNVDVSYFAHLHGGGGHKKAAGSVIPRSVITDSIHDLFVSCCTKE